METNLHLLIGIVVAVGITIYVLIMLGRKQERKKMDEESKDAMLRVLRNQEKVDDAVSKMSDSELDSRL